MVMRRILAGAFTYLLATWPVWAAYYGTTPFPVAGGGTGLGTLTAHGLMVGAGTGNVAFAGPGGTSGIPLIAQGASADPIFGTAVVAGGGTGVATLAAHGVVVGEGTGNVAVAAAGADSVLAWGSSSSDPSAVSIGNCTTALTYSTGTHTFGCNASAGVIPTVVTSVASSPVTLATTNLLTTISSMTTPAAITYNLPTAVQTAGWRECLKDGTTNFATNNATVKSPTSGTIDGIAGATGIVMNQTHQEMCFISDATNWFIE